MTRDEVISALENVDRSDDKALAALDEQLRQRVINDQAIRASWADDFERALGYAVILLSGRHNFFDKKVNHFLRPNKRSVLIGIAMVIAIAFELVLMLLAIQNMSNQAYGFAGIIFVFLLEFSVFMWFMDRVRKKNLVSDLGMHAYCVKCKYSLEGLDQALGGQLVVGPAVCPECGCSYPAVG